MASPVKVRTASPLYSAARTIEGDLAADAYLFGYPLVLMDVARATITNEFAHQRELPNATTTGVESPSADTLASVAWLDLARDPVILSVPDMGKRYGLIALFDAWTNVFTSLGTRTTGGRAGHFAITGPRWSGRLPDGMTEIKAPTNVVWLIGRTQIDGTGDSATVREIQDSYRLTPLSEWGTPLARTERSPVMPIKTITLAAEQVVTMDAEPFFSRLNALMVANPPSLSDAAAMARFGAIGVGPGRTFDARIPGLNAGVESARMRLTTAATRPHGIPVNGWDVLAYGMGRYGTNYLLRATIAAARLGSNLLADEVNPTGRMDSHARPLSGNNRYFLRFTRGKLPPANAFWSLTMYNERLLFAQNPIDRYALGSRDELAFGEDGSLTLFIQRESPGRDRESNWLPAPPGPFHVALRLYSPAKEAIDGTWRPPAIERGS